MKDNTVKYIALAILLAGGVFLYTRVQANKKTDDVDVIINAGMHSNKMFLETLQPEFVKAWASAVKSGATTFQFGGKTISTKGGKTVK